MINKKKKSTTVILMYIFSLIFLLFFIYYLFLAYKTIGNIKDSGQTILITDIISTYISGCSPYLFYSLACYAFGHLITSKEK
ncbi:hypothetical protein [Amedibacterium intestinale]|uniref:hypothetical protein n=1 Tax=Amedibacterium intestinale TaxID=2583452 RepID=UPI0039928A71